MTTRVEKLELLQRVRAGFEGREKDLRSYLKHDLRNHILPSVILYGVITGDEPVLESPDFRTEIEIYQTILDRVVQFDPQDTPPVFARQLRRAPFLSSIMPAIRGSIDFLNEPTFQNYQMFHQTRVPLQSVLRVAGADTLARNGDTINGPRAIMALNLMGNAKKFGIGKRFHVDITDDILSIHNLSWHPLPENPYQLGVKGKAGSHGFGLFITGMYAGLEDIPLSVSQRTIPEGFHERTVWDIRTGFPRTETWERLEPLKGFPVFAMDLTPTRPI